MKKETLKAFHPMSVVMTLTDSFDLSRGGMIVKPNNLPLTTQNLNITMYWLSDQAFSPNSQFIIKHTSNEVKAKVQETLYKIDINTLSQCKNNTQIEMNDIVRVKVRVDRPLFVDHYSVNKKTGSLIMIDEQTHNTVAAGIID